MEKNSKYSKLTDFLLSRHRLGIDSLTMTFSEVGNVCGFALPKTMFKYHWVNDKTQSSARGWLSADFCVDHCDLEKQEVAFLYAPGRVRQLLGGVRTSRGVTVKKDRHSKLGSKNRAAEPTVPLSEAEIERAYALFLSDASYQSDTELIRKAFQRFPTNTDPEIVAMKISLIDCTNSTHLGSHRGKMCIEELVQLITHMPDFDKRLQNGDATLVGDIAKANGKINLFSFASKYCLYHNTLVYDKDDFSIFDSIVAKHLPRYVPGLTQAQVERWRKNYDYTAFNQCIGAYLDAHHIHCDHRRRKFDVFLWYLNK